MRIRHKILAGYLALIAVAVVVVFFFLITIGDINDRYSELIKRDQNVLIQANNLRSGVQRQIVAARTYENSPDISLIVEYNDALSTTQQSINNITPLLVLDQDRQTIKEIESASNTYTQLANETIDLVNKGDRSQDLVQASMQSETARLVLISNIEGFIARKNAQIGAGQFAKANVGDFAVVELPARVRENR